VATTNDVGNNQSWLEAIHLSLMGERATEWSNFLLVLKSNGISLNHSKDKIAWSWNKAMGTVRTNLAYQSITFSNTIEDIRWWYKSIWKVKIPVKIICFMWLCLKDCILT
jgi:hypothetical protein